MSTSLVQLKADVMTIVKRPDLVDAVALHIKNAILKVHSLDYWKPDLYENAFQFAVAATQYSLDTKSLVSRWKKVAYLNVIDPLTGVVIRSVSPIDVLNTIDSYNTIKDYVFYEAGGYLQIRASGSEKNYNFGAYLYPDVTLNTPSWIVEGVPSAIHYEAARTLFKTIGFDEQSSKMDTLFQEAMAQVRLIGLPIIGD